MSQFLAFRFPLGKIIVHTVKNLSKPISRMTKNFAKANPYFRRYVCTIPGQLYYNLEVRSKMFMLGLKQPKRVPPLNPAMATEIGANLLSEVTFLAIAIYLIYFEVSRQARKDQMKHEMHRQRRQEIQDEIDDLDKHVNDLNRQLKQLKEYRI